MSEEAKELKERICKNCKFFNRMLHYDDCDKGVSCNVQIIGNDVIAHVYEDFGCIKWIKVEEDIKNT